MNSFHSLLITREQPVVAALSSAGGNVNLLMPVKLLTSVQRSIVNGAGWRHARAQLLCVGPPARAGSLA